MAKDEFIFIPSIGENVHWPGRVSYIFSYARRSSAQRETQ